MGESRSRVFILVASTVAVCVGIVYVARRRKSNEQNKGGSACEGYALPKAVTSSMDDHKFDPQDGINFYYFARSPCARRVWITLIEKKIPFRPVAVNLMAGEQRNPSFLRVNDQGKVPVLVVRNHPDGIPDCTIFEAQAITEWLDEQFPDTKQLLPASLADRVATKMWQYWELSLAEEVWPLSRQNVDGVVWRFLYSPEAFKSVGPPSQTQDEFYRQKVMTLYDGTYLTEGQRKRSVMRILQGFKMLDAALSERQGDSGLFLLGDELTQADIAVYPRLTKMPQNGIVSSQAERRLFSSVMSYFSQLRGLPCMKRFMADDDKIWNSGTFPKFLPAFWGSLIPWSVVVAVGNLRTGNFSFKRIGQKDIDDDVLQAALAEVDAVPMRALPRELPVPQAMAADSATGDSPVTDKAVLYYDTSLPLSAAVQICCGLLGHCRYIKVRVDSSTLENFSRAHLRRMPFGELPVLVIGGRAVYGPQIIVELMHSLYKNPSAYPGVTLKSRIATAAATAIPATSLLHPGTTLASTSAEGGSLGSSALSERSRSFSSSASPPVTYYSPSGSGSASVTATAAAAAAAAAVSTSLANSPRTRPNPKYIKLTAPEDLSPTQRAVLRRWFGWTRTAWHYQLQHVHRQNLVERLRQLYPVRSDLEAALRAGVNSGNSESSEEENVLEVQRVLQSLGSTSQLVKSASSDAMSAVGDGCETLTMVTSKMAIDDLLELYDDPNHDLSGYIDELASRVDVIEKALADSEIEHQNESSRKASISSVEEFHEEVQSLYLVGNKPTYADIFVLVTILLSEKLCDGKLVIYSQRHRLVCRWIEDLMGDSTIRKHVEEMLLLNQVSCSGKCKSLAGSCRSLQSSPLPPRDMNWRRSASPGYSHYSLVHGVVYPPFISETAVDLLRTHFKSRAGDIFICSYPTSGVTWMQQLLVLLLHWTDPDFGKSKANPAVLQSYSPWLEGSFCAPKHHLDVMRSFLDWSSLDSCPSIEHPMTVASISAEQGPTAANSPKRGGNHVNSRRRIFKTHAPYQLFPCSEENLHPESKIIYLARNPKNVACSAYSRAKSSPEFGFDGNWEEFFERMYMTGQCESGSWFDHNIGWYKASRDSQVGKNGQILNVYYEDLQRDLANQLERIAKFIGVSTTPEMIAKVIELSSLSDMVKKKPVMVPSGKLSKKSSVNSASKLMERLGNAVEKATWHVDNGGLVNDAQSRMIDKVFRESMPTELYKINLQHGISRAGDLMFRENDEE